MGLESLLGGVLGGLQIAGVLPAPVQTGVSPMIQAAGNGQAVGLTPPGGGSRTPGAAVIIDMILDGAGDAAVRAAARMARVGKRDMLETLVAIDIMGGGAAFTPTQKMFVSNEIEKIFKPRRRPIIPKSLRRTMKQIKFLKKELGPLLR